MGVFVRDTFTDTDGTLLESHTGELGATWTLHPSFSAGNAEIQGNKVHLLDPVPAYYASGVPPSAEYTLYCEFSLEANIDANTTLELYGRFSTSVNTHYDVIMNFFNQEWSLRKVVASSGTVLGTFPMTIDARRGWRVKFILRDAKKSLYVNDELLLTSTDNEITDANRAGLLFGGLSSEVYVDNFLALTTKTLLT